MLRACTGSDTMTQQLAHLQTVCLSFTPLWPLIHDDTG